MAISVLYAPAGFAEDPPQIVEIRALVTQVDALAKDPSIEKKDRYTTLDKTGNPLWHKGPPSDEPEYVFDVAEVYVSSAAIRLIKLDSSDGGAGDWSRTARYYYRPDGTLAFLYAKLATFEGNVKVETRSYYNPKGKIVRDLEAVFDLESGKKLTNASFKREYPPVYLTTHDFKTATGMTN